MMELNKSQPHSVSGKLAKEFMKNPITPFLIGLILILGFLVLLVIPREENPQIIVSGGVVIVPMPGVDAKKIKKVIVEPLEKKIKEVKGVENIVSIAKDNIGIINVSYYMGTNKESANLKLYDIVMQNLDILPKGAMMPLIKPLDIDNDIPIMTIALFPLNSALAHTATYEKAREIQRLIGGITNVSKVTIKGGSKAQYNIFVDLKKLSAYHISLAQVTSALESLSTNSPEISNTTQNGSQQVLFGVHNAIEEEKDIQNIIIAKYNHSPIYLKDIATVERGIDIQNKKMAEITFRNGLGAWHSVVPQVTIEISKAGGTNAVFLTDDIKKFMTANKEKLELEGMGYRITRDDGERANDSVNELIFHIILATFFITLLVWVVLGWKEALIVTSTIPLVLALSLIVIYSCGMTLNRITLFGFLLTMGLLVDAGIIVIENIHRHLHGNTASIEDVCLSAIDEVGLPTNIATIAIIFTTLPALLIGKMMGEFTAPIPKMMAIVLLLSLLVAYTIVPYLAKKYMKK